MSNWIAALVTSLLLWRDTVMKVTYERQSLLGLRVPRGRVHDHHDGGMTAGRHGTGAVARVYILFCGQERWRGWGKTSPQRHTFFNKVTTSNPFRIVPSMQGKHSNIWAYGSHSYSYYCMFPGQKWRWVSYGCSMCMMLASTDWEKGSQDLCGAQDVSALQALPNRLVKELAVGQREAN